VAQVGRQPRLEQVDGLEQVPVGRDDEVLLGHPRRPFSLAIMSFPTVVQQRGTRNEGGPVAKRWTERPPGSTWGDWGDDDELGRINLLTPAKVLQGVREVEAGITFSLSLPLDFPGGTSP